MQNLLSCHVPPYIPNILFMVEPARTINNQIKQDTKIHTLKYRGIIYSILDVKTNGFKNVEQIVIAKIAFGIGNTNEIVRSLVLQNGNNLVVQDGNSLILE